MKPNKKENKKNTKMETEAQRRIRLALTYHPASCRAFVTSPARADNARPLAA